MTTINSVGLGLSGATGTGNFVGSTSPVLVTPTLGNATATTLTFNPTTGGIVGTTSANNTNAGNVGELIKFSLSSASPASLTTTVILDICSGTLTAGDWDVWGNILYNTAATTVLLSYSGWLNTTSATQPDLSLTSGLSYGVAGIVPAGTYATGFTVPQQRISLSGNATIYLSTLTTFSTSTLTCYGNIFARRVR